MKILVTENVLLEIIDKKMPKGVKHGTFVRNRGTNSAMEYQKFTFTTAKNNKVKIVVLLKHVGDDKIGDIRFFVNDEMDSNPNQPLDFDILRGVFSYLPKIVEKFNLNKIQIESHTDEGDDKILRKLPYKDLEKELKEKITAILPFFKQDILRYIESYQNMVLDWVERFLKYLDGDESQWDIEKAYKVADLRYFQEINSLYLKYRDAKLSYRPEGLLTSVNRRHNIYKKLLPKFLPDWDIEETPFIKGFELTKRNLKTTSL